MHYIIFEDLFQEMSKFWIFFFIKTSLFMISIQREVGVGWAVVFWVDILHHSSAFLELYHVFFFIRDPAFMMAILHMDCPIHPIMGLDMPS